MAVAETGHVKITLCRSTHGRHASHQACVRGLGLRRIWQTVVVDDTKENRGMIEKIAYLLRIEE